MTGLRRGWDAPVVALADWRAASSALTEADRHALRRWDGAGRRVSFCCGEAGPYALLYDRAAVWASWGVARFRRRVSLWNCVTLDDVGLFECAADALAVLSHPGAARMAAATVVALPPRAGPQAPAPT